MAAARVHLCGGQGHAEARRADLADEVEQPTPATAEIENSAAGLDPDSLRHVLVLAPLRLLESQREVTVVLRAAEIRQLPQTEANDPVGQRIAEVDVRALAHGCQT